jgi:hypothetical protein
MDQGTKTAPNLASFLRFTTKGLWLPTGVIHGFDLGNILMVNSSYGTETEKVPYAVDGNNVIAMEEAIMVAPVWTIEGNQYHTRIRELLVMGTKNADATIGVSAGSPQTITGAIPGGSYDLGVRGLTSFASLTNVGATVTYVVNVDYEIDLITGILRIIDGGAITAATTVVATYLSSALTRESHTAFNNQNQTGTLKCFGLRTGRAIVSEEWVFTGNLYTESLGDADPKKHKSWKMKLSAAGNPTCYSLKI